MYGSDMQNIEDMSQARVAEMAALYLKNIEPGTYPLTLFEQLARLVVTSTVEIVPLRVKHDTIEVLLARRPSDDPWWPGQWHLPGTVLLPNEAIEHTRDYDTSIDRLLASEFNQSIKRDGAANMFDVQRRVTPRGTEQTVLCWVLVSMNSEDEALSNARFFNAETVHSVLDAESVIDGHIETVQRALSEYRATNGK